MYSLSTEFLTPSGWKRANEISDEVDCLAFDDGEGGLSWFSPSDCNLVHYNFEVSLYECQISKFGKFCIASDIPIRFFGSSGRSKSGDKGKVSEYDLLRIINRLQKYDAIPGYIKGSISKVPIIDSATQDTAVFIALAFRTLYRIDDDGTLYFTINRCVSRQSILDFLLTDSKLDPSRISFDENNTKVIVSGFSFADIFLSVLRNPVPLYTVVNDMYSRDRAGRSAKLSWLKFYCKNLADLAQLSIFLSDLNSKVIFDHSSSSRSNNWLVSTDSSPSSISFRNKTIILACDEESVCLNKPHPVTRYDGRISIL